MTMRHGCIVIAGAHKGTRAGYPGVRMMEEGGEGTTSETDPLQTLIGTTDPGNFPPDGYASALEGYAAFARGRVCGVGSKAGTAAPVLVMPHCHARVFEGERVSLVLPRIGPRARARRHVHGPVISPWKAGFPPVIVTVVLLG